MIVLFSDFVCYVFFIRFLFVPKAKVDAFTRRNSADHFIFHLTASLKKKSFTDRKLR